MLGYFRRMWKKEEGQGTTEYILIIGVIVVAVVAAAAVFIPKFKEGAKDLGSDIATKTQSQAEQSFTDANNNINKE